MKKLSMMISIGIGLWFWQSSAAVSKAITIVPIADLIGSAFQDKCSTKNIFNYNNLPLCGQRHSDCIRIHQLLFNEVVTILEHKGDEVKIQIPTVYYEHEQGNQRYDTYWSLKKNFMTFQELAHHGISNDYFPEPISFDSVKSLRSKRSNKTVVLMFPFKDYVTKQLYSAGTRFIVDNEHAQKGYTVFIFDSKKNYVLKTIIPKSLARLENNNEENQVKINNFVDLLKRWTKYCGIIPYVLGGCSFSKAYPDTPFELIPNDDSGSYYQRSSCKENPKNGFDCTGLIARAAQICGLPYYFKNSTTIIKNLKVLADNQSLVEGDLIWIPGHIMIVASKQHNSLIEARGYDHGFGKVQEIPLEKVFKGVATFSELHEAYKKKMQLQRLNNNGRVVQYIDQFKLLKLSSLWS